MKHLILCACLALSSLAVNADEYVNEGKYIYKYTPYSQIKSRNPMIRETAQLAHVALVSTLESLQKHGILPEKVMSKRDLDDLRARRRDVDDLVDYLNKYINEERGRTGFSIFDDITSLLPDAFLIFGGKKVQVALGKSVGVSLSVGLVIMPAWVQKIEVETGKVVEEGLTIRSSLVGWPSGDLGFGVGGGARMRFGFGMIWDLNNSFVNPDQFWGAGLGFSWTPAALGAGVNMKGGLLSNWEMPGWVDFTYLTAAMEVGLVGEIGTPHINVTTIVSGSQFMSMFEKSNQKAFDQAMREVNRTMDKKMKELRESLTEEKIGSRDDDRDSDRDKDDKDDKDDDGVGTRKGKKGGQTGRPVIPRDEK